MNKAILLTALVATGLGAAGGYWLALQHRGGTVDTVEQIELTIPSAGNYTVRVRGTSVPSGPQNYVLLSNLPLVDVVAPSGLLPRVRRMSSAPSGRVHTQARRIPPAAARGEAQTTERRDRWAA